MKIRAATNADCPQMSDLLNEIIRIGGTNALEGQVTGGMIAEWMSRGGAQASWIVAEDTDGSILGFQWVEPNPKLPSEATDIATFVKVGITGRGIGARLFDATQQAARDRGYHWINAAIRSDNVSGLTYYSRMGFADWHRDPHAALSDGTVTGKTYKRFDLN